MKTALSPGTADRVIAAVFGPPEWFAANRSPLEPHQTPPPGNWSVWVLMGGRGSGKTEGGARYFAKWMNDHPGHRGRIIAPTQGDAFESCIDGPSGLRAVDPSVRVMPSAPGGAKVVWPNGSEALILGTYGPGEVERLRASGNRNIDWWEEAAANRQFAKAWDQADFGLRLGDRPHSIITTTPRNVKKLRELLADPATVKTQGTINDNPHLPNDKKQRLIERYKGTRLGRQELDGELLTDIPGALWTWEMIEYANLTVEVPSFSRVVVAVDPAVTSEEGSDETGIMVCALGTDGRGYVLADRSCHVTPNEWAHKAVEAYDEFEADRIVGESNNGGDLVETVIRTVRPNISYRKVNASRGKKLRAEPVAALYEQKKVSHLVLLQELEEQQTAWTPDSSDSPDRLDALVWGFTELGLAGSGSKRWRVA